jgi:hypothetical protein
VSMLSFLVLLQHTRSFSLWWSMVIACWSEE